MLWMTMVRRMQCNLVNWQRMMRDKESLKIMGDHGNKNVMLSSELAVVDGAIKDYG